MFISACTIYTEIPFVVGPFESFADFIERTVLLIIVWFFCMWVRRDFLAIITSGGLGHLNCPNLSRRSGPAKVFGKFTELERHHARDTHWAKIFKKVHFSIYKKWLHAHDFPKIILRMEMNWGIKLILVFLVIHIVSF